VTFSFVRAQKLISDIGIPENIEKRLFYFGLRIRLPIQIQLLEIETRKIQKSTPPTLYGHRNL
jgi:hypothetical protein